MERFVTGSHRRFCSLSFFLVRCSIAFLLLQVYAPFVCAEVLPATKRFSRCMRFRGWFATSCVGGCVAVFSFSFFRSAASACCHMLKMEFFFECAIFHKCAAALPYRRKRKSFQASQRKRNTLGSCERNMTSCRFYCSKTQLKSL